jgi:hypothetical protein
MSDEETIVTARELMAKLEKLPPDALIMFKCSDEFYSGLVSEMTVAQAFFFGPKDYFGPSEDERGIPIKPRTYTWEGGWIAVGEEDDRDYGPILDRRTALVLST